MVLCEGATILNLVASVLMNGACCIHAMDEEERRKKETRDTMRKAISVEWQRQRLIEQEQQERFLREQGMDAASVMADERRRLYIATKMMASSQHSSRVSYSSRASYSSRSQASEREHLHYDKFIPHNLINKRDNDQDQITLPESPNPRFKFGASKDDYSSRGTKGGLNSRSRSAPIEAERSCSRRIPLLVGPVSSMASSLFDGGSDDDEFDEVQLQ